MSFANNSMYLKYDEIVDDPVPPVSSNEIHAFSQYDRSGLKEQNKAVIPINEPLILPERIQIRDQIIQQACQNAEEMSPIIQDVIHRFDLPTEIKSKIRTITFRGPIGAGKSYWLKDLGINEHKISNADSLKEFLGGNLSHHESCVLSAAIRKNTGSFFQIDFNTNVRQRDLDKLTNPPKGAVNLILDLNISLDKLIDHHQTIIQQGNRQASEKEIFDSHSDSINHRVYVIKAALENENIVWQLYDNNADNRALVVSIINKEVKIERPDLLEKLLEGQDQMRELFLYHSSLKNNAFINQGLIRV